MWALIVNNSSVGHYESRHGTKEAAFARLKMLYPNPESMSCYSTDMCIDFSFKCGEDLISGFIIPKEEPEEP